MLNKRTNLAGHIICGLNVQRLHTIKTIFKQSVGEHSARVAGLLIAVYAPERVPYELLHHAILHDVAEFRTGDVPAPIKWSSDEISRALKEENEIFWQEIGLDARVGLLNRSQYLIFKTADYLDLAIFCNDEIGLGNSYVAGVATNALAAVYRNLEDVDFPTHVKSNFEEILKGYGLERQVSQ